MFKIFWSVLEPARTARGDRIAAVASLHDVGE